MRDLLSGALSTLVFASSIAIALLAGSVPLRETVSVFGSKFVAIFAMRFGVEQCSIEPTRAIDFMRDWFKVVRIYAGMNAAKVVELFAFWNWSYKEFVRNNMVTA